MELRRTAQAKAIGELLNDLCGIGSGANCVEYTVVFRSGRPAGKCIRAPVVGEMQNDRNEEQLDTEEQGRNTNG